MIFRTLAAVALAGLLLVPAAKAADIDQSGGDYTRDSSSPNYSWTGVYLGALGGYQFSNSALNYDENCFTDEGERVYGSSLEVDGLGADGLFGEIQVGLDKQVGQRLVLGAFAGLNISDSEFEISGSHFDGLTTEGGSILSFSQEWGGVVGARAGFLTNPNTMIYVAGGWAFGEIGKLRGAFGEDGAQVDVLPQQETDLNGYFAEIGLETRITKNLLFTLAGRYTDYGAITLFEEAEGGHTQSLELDHDTLSIMAGLKLKLNTSDVGLGD